MIPSLQHIVSMIYLFIEVTEMTISKEKTRTNITISKELKRELESLAKENNRSFNNYIITVLENHLKPTK